MGGILESLTGGGGGTDMPEWNEAAIHSLFNEIFNLYNSGQLSEAMDTTYDPLAPERRFAPRDQWDVTGAKLFNDYLTNIFGPQQDSIRDASRQLISGYPFNDESDRMGGIFDRAEAGIPYNETLGPMSRDPLRTSSLAPGQFMGSQGPLPTQFEKGTGFSSGHANNFSAPTAKNINFAAPGNFNDYGLMNFVNDAFGPNPNIDDIISGSRLDSERWLTEELAPQLRRHAIGQNNLGSSRLDIPLGIALRGIGESDRAFGGGLRFQDLESRLNRALQAGTSLGGFDIGQQNAATARAAAEGDYELGKGYLGLAGSELGFKMDLEGWGANEGMRRTDNALKEQIREYDSDYAQSDRFFDNEFLETMRMNTGLFDQSENHFINEFLDRQRVHDSGFRENARQYDNTETRMRQNDEITNLLNTLGMSLGVSEDQMKSILAGTGIMSNYGDNILDLAQGTQEIGDPLRDFEQESYDAHADYYNEFQTNEQARQAKDAQALAFIAEILRAAAGGSIQEGDGSSGGLLGALSGMFNWQHTSS